MFGAHSLRPCPKTRSALRGRKPAESAQHTPRQNQLLAALPPKDYERLLPDLESFALPLHWTVHDAGDRDNYLYFVTEGIVSRFYVTESGAMTAFAVTGNEGVIGIASFLGGESTPSQALVLSAGYSYRIRAERLKHEFEHDVPLRRLLLRHTQALITQMAQVAACNRHHSVDQQLCRWLLLSVDRLASSELSITHESIAGMLGVRREGVTEAAGKLQAEGLIRYHRGRITVLDRPRLEGRACECYQVVKMEFNRLLSCAAT